MSALINFCKTPTATNRDVGVVVKWWHRIIQTNSITIVFKLVVYTNERHNGGILLAFEFTRFASGCNKTRDNENCVNRILFELYMCIFNEQIQIWFVVYYRFAKSSSYGYHVSRYLSNQIILYFSFKFKTKPNKCSMCHQVKRFDYLCGCWEPNNNQQKAQREQIHCVTQSRNNHKTCRVWETQNGTQRIVIVTNLIICCSYHVFLLT